MPVDNVVRSEGEVVGYGVISNQTYDVCLLLLFEESMTRWER